MRVLAGIYLCMMGLDMYLWLHATESWGAMASPRVLLLWVLYASTIAALFGIVMKRRFFKPQVWATLLVLYVATRLIEIFVNGFPIGSGDVNRDLNFVFNYLLIAVPPALAMYYQAFVFQPKFESAGLTADRRAQTMG